ncbi:MAG TPA: acyltransferase [Caulobacterales bacterium]|nr:acyltransferase [Caulobacterales bacterium]
METRVPNSSNASDVQRISALDSIRGIAAFTVFLVHWLSFVMPPVASASKLDMALKAFVHLGHPAVIVFFVLSGFVLAGFLFNKPDTPYANFALKRLVRLYPAFAVSIVLGCGLYLLTYSHQAKGFNAEFWADWDAPPNPVMLLRHFLLLGIVDSDLTLNGPMWSLVYEMRLSLLMPLLAFAALRAPWALLVAAAGAYVVTEPMIEALGLSSRPYLGGSLVGSVLVTLHYVFPFAVGALLARLWRDGWPKRALTPAMELAIVALGLGALAAENDFVTTLAAAAIIGVALKGRVLRRWLMQRPLVWLGKISYSLYLFHVPVMLAVVHAGSPLFPHWLLFGASLALSFAVATAMYHWVEAPSVAWAQKVGRMRLAIPRLWHERPGI